MTGPTHLSETSGCNRRSIKILTLKAILFLVFAIVLTEAFLRFGLGLGNPVLIIPDPACEYILKPNQNVFRFFVHTHINQYGMRSDEIPSGRIPGTLRLLFVGDSITYGTTQVDQAKIFTEVLHHDLVGILKRPVEVLNASAGAWAIDNELSFVRSRGIFQSDFVVLVLNDGDVTQPRSTIEQVGDLLPHQRPSTAIEELYTRFIRPRFRYMVRRDDAGDIVNPNAEHAIRDNLTDLDSFSNLVTSNNARFVIIYVPFRRDIPNLSSDAASILRNWSSNHHVPMLDVTSDELPYTAKQITIDNGVHFNPKGNQVVAQSIERQWSALVGP